MQLPETVEIMNRTYKVTEENLEESSYVGISRQNKGTIKIEESLDTQEKTNTFLHELIHVMIMGMGYNTCEKGERLHTEENITIISNGLATIMRDNPDTFRYIIDGLERDDLDKEEGDA